MPGWLAATFLFVMAACQADTGPPAPVEARSLESFSELERQEIYKRIVAAQDRGDDEAERELAANPPSRLTDWERRAEELGDQHKQALGAEIGLTLADLETLAAEGRRNGWEMD